MKLLVLGATGGIGGWIVRVAAERGHDVTAVARPSSGWTAPAGVHVVRGEVSDGGFVREVVRGHDVVLSGLGLRRASVLPWSRLLSPPHLVETVTRHLAEHAPADARVVWVSAGGVGDSRAQATLPIRRMIRLGNVGVAYADLECAEAAARPGWLAVRPVTLLRGAPTGRAKPVVRYGLFSTIRRADVATWMVDAAEAPAEQRGPAVLLGG